MIGKLSDTVTLNNGSEIPGLGLGVFQIPEADTAEVVKQAIINGYRLIDTAAIYGNETGTGAGIKQGLQETGLAREELFVTSKHWNDHLTYDETIHAFNESLARLNLEYLDLYLIHWPGNQAFQESWRALEDLYAAGKIKAIGVSNFQIHHLEQLLAVAKVVPVINQIELHPYFNQEEQRKWDADHGIVDESWSPLGRANSVLQDPVIGEIAKAHGKSISQIILRWHVQLGVLPIPKSSDPVRQKENLEVFDFVLSEEEMQKICALSRPDGRTANQDPSVYEEF